MILQNVIRILFFAVPLVTFVTCGIMTAIALTDTLRESLLKRILLLYYGISVITVFGVLFLPFAEEFPVPAEYIPLSISLLTAFCGVVFYNFVFVMTRTEEAERFPRRHYLFAGSLFVLLYGMLSARPIILNLLSTLSVTLSLIYVLLVIKRISKQTTGEKSNSSKDLISRKTLLIGAASLFPAISFTGLLLPWPEVYILFIPAILLLTVFHLISASRFSRHNYLFSPETVDNRNTHLRTPAVPVIEVTKELNEIRKLDKKHFDEYFKKHKPYLNKDFKITDLLEPFNTNRSYISSFVNRTYGIGFSHYVNAWRLREVERLKKLSQNKNKKTEQLLLKAGFANYRGYMRAKKFARENSHDEQ